MGKGVNKVILIGNLGNDPDIRFTQQGTCVANLSIATDESYKDKQSGQMVPKTEWHRVVLFDKLGEIAQSYLKKGSKVYIEGKIETRKWQDQGGQDRYTTEIKAHTMQMLDSKQEGMQQAPSQNQGYQQPPQAPQQQYVQNGQPMNPQQVQQQMQQPQDAPLDSNIPF